MQQNKPAQGLIGRVLFPKVFCLLVIDGNSTLGSDAEELTSCTKVANPLPTMKGCKLVITPAACVDCLGVVSHGVYLDWIKTDN